MSPSWQPALALTAGSLLQQCTWPTEGGHSGSGERYIGPLARRKTSENMSMIGLQVMQGLGAFKDIVLNVF